MDSKNHDKIFIRNLELRAVIGVHEHERKAPQPLILNLTLYTDQGPAAEADDIDRTVSYSQIMRSVSALAEGSAFRLIESLAAAVAELILESPGVLACRVAVDKPQALGGSVCAGVEIFREQERCP